MGRRKCCCAGCEVFVDDFNRDDDPTGPGSGWVEASGDWAIVSGELVSSANGLVYTTAGITNSQRRFVRVKCLDAQEGKVYKLCPIVDHTDNSYVYIEFACGASGLATLKLKNHPLDQTFDEQEVTYYPGEDYLLIACCTAEGIYGTLATESQFVWDCYQKDGDRAGVAGTGIEYDDFEFYRHAEDIAPTVDQRCPHCMCECDGHCLPKTLTLTINSTCEHRDGAQVTLTFDDSLYPRFKWTGSAMLEYPLSPGFSSLVTFTLYCATSGDNDFLLCADGYLDGQCSDDNYPQNDACGTGAHGDYPLEVICDPLQLTFGEYTCTGSGPPDPPPSCTESLIITE